MTDSEKMMLISAGWIFLNEECVYLPDDFDATYVYGIENIIAVLSRITTT